MIIVAIFVPEEYSDSLIIRFPPKSRRRLMKLQDQVGSLSRVAGAVIGICPPCTGVVTRTTSSRFGATKIRVSTAGNSRPSLATRTRRADCGALARWVFERDCEKNISEHTRAM